MRPTGNTAPGPTIAAALFLTWAGLTFALRLCTKWGKRDAWGYDDSAMTVAFLTGAANVTAVCYAIHHGFGNEWTSLDPADMLKAEKALYAASILYVIAMGFTRISASLFAERLLTQDMNSATGHAPLVLYLIWTLASTFAVAFRGNLEDPWATRNGSRAMFMRYLGIEISGLILDAVIVSLAIRVVWTLSIPTAKRMVPSTIFACRLFIVPVIALRLWQLRPAAYTHPRPNLFHTVYTQAALHSAFMLASSTHIAPFLKPFCEGYYPDTSRYVDASGYDRRSKATVDVRRISCVAPSSSKEGAKSSNRSASESTPATREDSAVSPQDELADVELIFLTEA